MQTRSSAKRVTRQSSRSVAVPNKRQLFVQFGELTTANKRRKMSLPAASSSRASSDAPSKQTHPSTATHLKSPPDQDLLIKEQCDELAKLHMELKQRTADLERLKTFASDKEKEDEESQRKQTLDFLEEHFTCALCLEIIAHPVTLPHPHCGHTFCAICILKHIFSRFHQPCGTWHEGVECPMCRSALIYTSQSPPRSIFTFPFARDRAADGAIMSLINQLAGGKVVKKKPRGKGKGKAKEDADEVAVSWMNGGSSRTDWLDRHTQGKAEVEYLSKNWSTLVAGDFTALKMRLRV